MSSLSSDTISESQKNTWSWFYKNIDFDKMEQPSNDLSVSGVCDNFMVSFYDSDNIQYHKVSIFLVLTLSPV